MALKLISRSPGFALLPLLDRQNSCPCCKIRGRAAKELLGARALQSEIIDVVYFVGIVSLANKYQNVRFS